MAKTPKLGTADSILGVSQILGAADQGGLSEEISQSLGLGQSAVGTLVGSLRVSNYTIQVLWNQGALSADAENTLGLTDDVLFFLAIDDRKIINQSLGLVQAADFGEERAENELELIQTLEFLGPQYTTPVNNLGLQQGVHVCFGRWGANEIEQSLTLTDIVGFGKPFAASNTLSLVQEAARIFAVSQSLSLAQDATGGKSFAIEQELDLSQVADADVLYNRGVSQGSFVKQALTYFIDTACNRKRYARFDGEGEGTALPPKRLTFASDFVLQSGSTTLRLRSPETDDRDRVSFNRISRETRGGELNIFADSTWPRVNTLLFTIVALKKEKIEALQDFFQATLGQEIKIHDWTGISWLGVVTTPDDAATEDQDGYWTMTFEFEGTPFDGPAVDDTLSLSHQIGIEGLWTRSASHEDVVSQSVDHVLETP